MAYQLQPGGTIMLWRRKTLCELAGALVSARVVAPLVGLGVLLGAPAAIASDSSESQAVQTQGTLEEIIVTARKRSESLEAAPVAVSAFSTADLEARSITDITGIAAATPNLSLFASANGGGGGNVAQASIRGVGQSDFLPTAEPGVGIYVDGVYLGRTIGGILSMADMQQIEVLRGPQGTLFGRNSVGGAINVTTRGPSFNPEGYVDVSGGNFSLLQLEGAAGGALVPERVAGRIAVQYRDERGYQSSPNFPYKWGNEDKLSARGQLLFQVSETWSARLAVDFYHQNQQSQPSALLGIIPSGFPAPGTAPNLFDLWNFSTTAFGGPLKAPPVLPSDVVPRSNPFVVSKTGPSGDYARIWGTSATIDGALGGGAHFKSITAYRSLHDDFAEDADAVLPEVAYDSDHERQWQVSQELQLSADTARLNWLAGLFYFHEHASNINGGGLLQPAFEAGSPFAPPISQQQNNLLQTNSYAAFVHLTWKLTQHLNGELGVRYTSEKKNFDVSLLNLNVAALGLPNIGPFPLYFVPPTRESASFSNVSPLAGLNYTTDGGLLLYGHYSRGFKSGTFNGRPESPLELGVVQPETVDAYEVGAKGEFLEHRLRVNTAVFYDSYKEIQLIAVENGPNGTLPFLLNAAKARIPGAELEVNAQVSRYLRLDWTLAYLDSEIREVDARTAAAGVVAGNQLRNAPRWSGSLGLETTIPLTSGDIIARVDGNTRSSQFHEATNNPLTREGGYSLLNARLAFRPHTDRWEVAIWGKNLTDKVYYNGIFIAGGTAAIGYPVRPREYGATVRYRF